MSNKFQPTTQSRPLQIVVIRQSHSDCFVHYKPFGPGWMLASQLISTLRVAVPAAVIIGLLLLRHFNW